MPDFIIVIIRPIFAFLFLLVAVLLTLFKPKYNLIEGIKK